MPSLLTQYGEKIKAEQPLQEYPRPQMVRDSYFCLNGPWDYAITAENRPPEIWDGEIVVPFAPESFLSGVQKTLLPHEYLWYRRRVALPDGFLKGCLLLHFGGVDQCCVVSVNGREAGRHDGGFLPFSLDITQHLQGNVLEISLMVIDETDTAPYGRGRQKLQNAGTWHSPMSGIWQTVWLESVPKVYIVALKITPLYDESAVEITVVGSGGALKGRVEVFARSAMAVAGAFTQGQPLRLQLAGALSWSPKNPFLYTLRVSAGKDCVVSYFGMRKIETGQDAIGLPCLLLNNKPLLTSGVLDQGMFSDSLYTPPSDEAMIDDLKFAKQCGFNAIRKLNKIEPMRWYYHCDRVGLLVWQDLPGGGDEPKLGFSDRLFFSRRHRKDGAYLRFGRENAEGRQSFLRDMDSAAALLYNTPSLAVWVLFNEGYGQFDANKATKRMREKDPTRLIDHASGWDDQNVGDFLSVHSEGKAPIVPDPEEKRVAAFTALGGYGLRPAGHFAGKEPCAAKMAEDETHYHDLLRDLYTQQLSELIQNGVCVVFYSQLSDAEDEVSGLQSADRYMQKVQPAMLRKLNEQLAQQYNDNVK